MNENQYGNFTCVTKFVKFSYWFFVICKNYKFGYRVRFRIFDFYVFFNFGYGSEIGNFAGSVSTLPVLAFLITW